MAEQMTAFPEAPATRRYPWDQWTQPGTSWKLVRGVDYDVETDKFRNRFYNLAKRRGLKVRTKRADENGTEALMIEFFEPSGTAL